MMSIGTFSINGYINSMSSCKHVTSCILAFLKSTETSQVTHVICENGAMNRKQLLQETYNEFSGELYSMPSVSIARFSPVGSNSMTKKSHTHTVYIHINMISFTSLILSLSVAFFLLLTNIHSFFNYDCCCSFFLLRFTVFLVLE